MQVLKFGGSSVANAQNMAKVIDIVVNAVDRDRTILVSSAISGCTDTLIKIGTLASQRDESYKVLIDGQVSSASLSLMYCSCLPFFSLYSGGCAI